MRGKARRSLLKEITKFVGRLNSNIVLPPSPSLDAGAERLFGITRVYATDPALGVPLEDLGYFAFHLSASDVAVMGAEPRIMTSTILLPSDFDGEVALKLAKDISWEAYRYGVSVITGHTGWYSSLKEPVVVTTVIGEVKDPITPDLARSGDTLLLVGIPGAEFLYGLAHFRPDLLLEVSNRRTVERWKRARWMLTAVDKARNLAMLARVNGMKDGAEGGLIRLLNDFADASGLGFVIWRERIFFPPELVRLGRKLGFDPLAASSSGLVLAVIPRASPLEFLRELMESHGFHISIIGELRTEGRRIVTGGEVKDFPEEAVDPYTML
ncbi:MAG: hypothetical protein J7L91_01225 [Candidatus Korarchaeota archaeon]|nr:hypothetical protein [Candidatus Korarchaeota archaeon]